MGFNVETVREAPVSAEGSPPALPHEEIVGNQIPIGDTTNVTMGQHVGARVLKESTRKLFEMGTPAPTSPVTPAAASPPPVAVATPAPAAPAAPVEPAAPAPAAATSATSTTTTAQAIADDVAARAARLAEHNSRLLAENESLKRSAVPADVADRIKAQDELDRLWLTDPVKAYEKKMASLLGVAEDAPDIAAHRGYFEVDLTHKRIGVPLTDDSDAARKAARTLAAIQLEMRARKADETKPTPPQTPPEDPAERIVAQHISGEKYPLIFSLTEHDYGVKPERMVWAEINHRLQIGQLDPKMTDAQLIDTVAPEIEARYEAQYQARVSKYTAAKRPSSATPVPIATVPVAAAPVEEKKPDPPSVVVPTLTNATASVAPATPPVPKAADKATYRNRMEKRIAIIKSHTN